MCYAAAKAGVDGFHKLRLKKTDGSTKSNVLIPNCSQKHATFLDLLIFTDAIHVSGGSSAHHQEHITVHTASGIVNQYCC